MAAPKVVISNRVHPDAIELLRTHCTVVANEQEVPWLGNDLLDKVRDAVGLMVFMNNCVDGEFLSRCPSLRIIASVLKGHDNFDVDACTRNGVWLTVVPDRLTSATAELAIGLMIAVSRHVVQGDAYVREGYRGWRPIFYGNGLAHQMVGILGMGAIGQAIARRLRAFDCRMQYFDKRPIAPDKAAALGARSTSFDQLLNSSDFLVIALPLTPCSQHLINADTIGRMKTGCYLINPARGSIVDEDAVAEALGGGKLAGYAADVFEMEDWARRDRPLSISPKLIAARARTVLTPHIGSAECRTRYEAEMEMANSILDYIAGRRPRGAINNPIFVRSRSAC